MLLYFYIFLIVQIISVSALSKHSTLIVTAFDGFRYDYLERNFTPILTEIAANGTKAKFMLNQFPTITFPNFHSISTGMHAETHGVLGNRAFNEKKQCMEYSYELFHYNQEIIPIWILNENSGDQRYSGVMMWPGSNFPYQNKNPTYQQPFNQSIPWKTRIDSVIEWITNIHKPANLVYLYFEQPDEDGHHYGPDSPQVNEQLRKINITVQYFLEQLSSKNIRDQVNLIFLADHGMASVNSNEVIDLDQYLEPNSYTFCGSSPGLQILPNPGHEQKVYDNLVQLSNKLKTFEVYKPEDIPDRWYYKNNRRNIGYFIEANMNHVFQDAKLLKGDHGYDNEELQMHPLFIAQGPLFKENYEIQPFSNIDLYPLISYIMELQPPPARVSPNGTLSSVKNMLRFFKTGYFYYSVY